jgi:arylsulfatase A-like enzyme
MVNDQIKTPNIDSIAKDGILFKNAHCNKPIYMSSRSKIFTWLPSSEHDVRTNGINLDDRYPALPQILKNKSYKTFSTGKLHLTSWEIGQFYNPELKEIAPNKSSESVVNWENGSINKIPDCYLGLDWIDVIGGHGRFFHENHANWLRETNPEEFKKFRETESSKKNFNDFGDKFSTIFSTIANELYYNEWIKNLTIEKIDRIEDNQLFFAWVSFPDPHWPFRPPAPFNQIYNPKELDKPVAWDDDKSKMPDFYTLTLYSIKGGINYESLNSAIN